MKDIFKIMAAIKFLISLSVGADVEAGTNAVQQGLAALTVRPNDGLGDGFDLLEEEEGGSGAQPSGTKVFDSVAKPSIVGALDAGPTAWETACGLGGTFVSKAGDICSAAMAKLTAMKCNTTGISQDEFCSLTLKELVDFCAQYSDQNPRKFWTTFKDTKRLSRLGIFDIQFGVVLGGDDKEVHGQNFFEFLREKVTNEPAIHFEKEMTKGRTESKIDIPGEGGEARKTIQYYSRYTNVDGKGTMIFVTLHAFRRTEKYF